MIEGFFNFPIGVQLFNRPEYAEKFLNSLRGQTLSIDEAKLFIFIDGFPGSIYEDKGWLNKTEEVKDLARNEFPQATIINFAENIGIADLHKRLQEIVFSGPEQWGAFFEEDLILSESYLEELSGLIEIVDDIEKVVKVACFQILPGLQNLPRGFDGFYPGRGTQAYAERKSFFHSKEAILSKFVELTMNNLSTPNQFKSWNGSATLALEGLILPYFQHDSLDEAFLLLQKKLHIVTKPGLAKDIGATGMHNYTTAPVVASSSCEVATGLIEDKREALQNQISQIQIEHEEYMKAIFQDLFQSFHVNRSRKAMIQKILQTTFRRKLI